MPYLACVLAVSSSSAAFSIASLAPGYQYQGPTATDMGNACKCTTVAYSLVSACDACQGSDWIEYDSSSPFPPFLFIRHQLVQLHGPLLRGSRPHNVSFLTRQSEQLALTRSTWTHSFPYPVPAGTRVPLWALIDITVGCFVFILRLPAHAVHPGLSQ